MWKVTLKTRTVRGGKWTRRLPMVWLASALTAAALPASVAAQMHEHGPSEQPAAQEVPLYDNLGDHQYAITTSQPLAQAYFDQGLRLYYAFNHSEAIRSFQRAQAIDPECAMCWWGEALAWGPNINMPMDEPGGVAAFAALEKVIETQDGANDRERALIQALATRYEAQPGEDRAHLDAAYAAAMVQLAARYPMDNEIGVLAAESVMDTRPWDYWTETGEPQEGIADALAGLDAVLARNENHPGACHFYIHAVEKLYPERAIPCAERLAALMPGAGHIVHMPGHIYIRVGRYREAIEANQHAVHADETYIQDQRPGATVYTAGYYPHNYDFLAFAAMMLGEEEESINAADQVEALIPVEMFGEPGMAFLQGWFTRPLQMRVRFERWDEVLAAAPPRGDLAYANAIWRYARGRAFAGRGDLDAARAELVALRELVASDEIASLKMEFNQAADLVAIAESVLSGRIAAAEGRFDDAVRSLEQAVAHEDALLYGEPPEWSVPTRQELGEVLMLAGRADAAAAAFQADLDHFPANIWSVRGLEAARGLIQGR